MDTVIARFVKLEHANNFRIQLLKQLKKVWVLVTNTTDVHFEVSVLDISGHAPSDELLTNCRTVLSIFQEGQITLVKDDDEGEGVTVHMSEFGNFEQY